MFRVQLAQRDNFPMNIHICINDDPIVARLIIGTLERSGERMFIVYIPLPTG